MIINDNAKSLMKDARGMRHEFFRNYLLVVSEDADSHKLVIDEIWGRGMALNFGWTQWASWPELRESQLAVEMTLHGNAFLSYREMTEILLDAYHVAETRRNEREHWLAVENELL